MSTATRRTFPARTDGSCGGCAMPIHVGDGVFFAGSQELPIGADCCGDRPDEELLTRNAYELPGDNLGGIDEDEASAVIARTLPRNKTARDACPKCRQIPASNGTCGCDY